MNGALIKNFLYTIEDLYTNNKGTELNQNGHGIDHIEGVICRASKITDMLKTDIDYSAINKNLVITCAALHDIGTFIDRQNHNHYGLGIIKGKLTIDDILKTPFKNDMGLYLSEESIDIIQNLFNSNLLQVVNRESEYFGSVKESLLTLIKFDLVYNDNEVKFDNFDEYLKDKYPKLSMDLKKAIRASIIDSQKKEILYQYDQNLSKITNDIKNIFNNSEIDIIADSVQDHNVDYESQYEKYQSRSIYGSIIYDADKDLSPEVFALRTLLFSLQKFSQINNEDFEKIKQLSIKEVLCQSWERFRNSDDPIFNDIIISKPTLQNVKGIENVKEVLYKNKEKTINELKKIKKQFLINENDRIFTFNTSNTEGEDLYSEIDNITNKHYVSDLRYNFTKTVQKWADVEQQQSSIEEISILCDELIEINNIDALTDKYEKQINKKLLNITDYTFSNIIEATINVTLDELLDNATQECNNNKKDNPIITTKIER